MFGKLGPENVPNTVENGQEARLGCLRLETAIVEWKFKPTLLT
jgi:hypothetical protein